ncbi:hypothetical protein RvY_06407 [Ramazzottius varieornatus]|uniref:CCR4-NOT transcription complex subunit 4 n=1 Tax=Ramazzottius varieornatus TaxID=947166 RepID=A0A1D1V3Z3_RAMVA|nr:hypothetical protein RvY_06407 [Ramazzottius varieornatus]
MTMEELDNGLGEDCIECPLCVEPFDLDDINFFPCTCGFQVCKFCWHRMKTDENGLCPACRQKYPDDPVEFKPIGAEEIQKFKSNKKQQQKVGQKKKDPREKTDRVIESRKHLATIRVVQKNLVFVIGLPPKLTDPEVLKKPEYFGRFGKILKVMVNTLNANGTPASSASAYITYLRGEDALRAIKMLNNFHIDGRVLKASLGTTKYCVNFLRNLPCSKTECMYLHDLGDGAASFTKEEMQGGKHQEYEKQLLDALTPLPLAPSILSVQQQSPVMAPPVPVPVLVQQLHRVPSQLPSSPSLAESVVLDRRESEAILKNNNDLLPRDLSPASSCSISSSSGSLNEAPPSDKDRTSPGTAPFDLFVDDFDDFGFDPWNESSKGLADLMELESQTRRTMPLHVPIRHVFEQQQQQQQQQYHQGLHQQQINQHFQQQQTMGTDHRLMSANNGPVFSDSALFYNQQQQQQQYACAPQGAATYATQVQQQQQQQQQQRRPAPMTHQHPDLMQGADMRYGGQGGKWPDMGRQMATYGLHSGSTLQQQLYLNGNGVAPHALMNYHQGAPAATMTPPQNPAMMMNNGNAANGSSSLQFHNARLSVL